MNKQCCLFLILFCFSYSSKAQNKKASVPDFIHTTYSVGGALTGEREIAQSNYAQFQFIYMMAAPTWNTVDFDQTQEKINEECVVNPIYEDKKRGLSLVPSFIKTAQKQKAKVLISFAGEGFNERVENPERRIKFVNMMVRFMEKYGYDGIEIDWETGVELPLHAVFMKEIRAELDKTEMRVNKRLYLTTALHYFQRYTQTLADEVMKEVDWINIMTYDMGGGLWGSKPTHNTPFAEIKESLEHWKVFPSNRLCIGLANYGFHYKGIGPNEKVEGKLDQYGKYISYNAFLPFLQQGWTEEFDVEQQVPYYFSPDKTEFVTMEKPSTIQTKIEWIKRQQYKGVFWWEFHYDFDLPESGNEKGKNKLIDIVSKYLKNR